MDDSEVDGCIMCYDENLRLYEGETRDLGDLEKCKICDFVEDEVRGMDGKIVKVVYKEDCVEFYVTECSMMLLQCRVNQKFGKYGYPFESWYEDEENGSPLLVAFKVYER